MPTDLEYLSNIRINELPPLDELLEAYDGDVINASAFLAELLSDEGREVYPDPTRRSPNISDHPYVAIPDLKTIYGNQYPSIAQLSSDYIGRYYAATELTLTAFYRDLNTWVRDDFEKTILLAIHKVDISFYSFLEILDILTDSVAFESIMVDPEKIEKFISQLTGEHFNRFRKAVDLLRVDGGNAGEIDGAVRYRKASESLSRELFTITQ